MTGLNHCKLCVDLSRRLVHLSSLATQPCMSHSQLLLPVKSVIGPLGNDATIDIEVLMSMDANLMLMGLQFV